MSNAGKKHMQRVAEYGRDNGCAVCGAPYDHVKELFDYDDGKLLWKHARGSRAKAGTEAGTMDAYGYRVVVILGKQYKAHHLVWVWHGNHPSELLDHIDGNPSNNKIENLRVANKSLNAANSKIRSDSSSGVKGVSFDRARGRWRAYITVKGKAKSLGYFDSIDSAATAYKCAATSLFGDYARVV